ncbi:hypothetical protein [Paraliomyxa miuraensis]|uniref:hypothetical protein n=1 Tax=Paraliomyxa miuraensis TaxID=376150 RepID=UPI00225554CC|nr:hypothetical protein [Paraliomyxa miuraensis]
MNVEGGFEVPAEGSTSAGTSDDDGDSESGGQAAPTWPEEFLGQYHDDALPLGVPAMYLGIVTNLELRRDSLRVTFLGCHGTEKIEQLAASFEGAEVHVRPEPGQTHVIWNGSPVAKALVIRPGSSCAELVMEFIEPVHPEGSFAAPWTWRRGVVYISDECGEGDSVWGADLSPDVPTGCEDPA